MTDVTEQFAEIMNKTIQEAADADERADKAGVLLAEALARSTEDKELLEFLKEEQEEDISLIAHELDLAHGVVFDQRQEIEELKAELGQLKAEHSEH
tara:strand:- start:375 stop:665 length:291 start_codon:yes stop_codon:yes gene_type:complete